MPTWSRLPRTSAAAPWDRSTSTALASGLIVHRSLPRPGPRVGILTQGQTRPVITKVKPAKVLRASGPWSRPLDSGRSPTSGLAQASRLPDVPTGSRSHRTSALWPSSGCPEPDRLTSRIKARAEKPHGRRSISWSAWAPRVSQPEWASRGSGAALPAALSGSANNGSKDPSETAPD
jgi:hypothetical protein